MLDSVGIRLPKYKVRELTLELQRTGELQDDAVDKMMFLQVNILNLKTFFGLSRVKSETFPFCAYFGEYKLIKHNTV